MIIVKVVLPIPIRQCFKYFMPDLMNPVIGGRVVVPFNSKDVIGIVVSTYKKNDISQLNLKYVKSLIDTKSLYTNITLNLIVWISKNYHCPIGNLFFSILPKILHSSFVTENQYIYQWNITQKGKELDLSYLKRRKKQLFALLFLKKNNILNTRLKQYNLSEVILKKLELQELCKKNFNYKLCVKRKVLILKKKIFINSKIFLFIKNILIKKCFSSWLISQITLYSKIKFYLGLIKSVLYKGMQILIVVPYIKNINIIVVFLKKYFDATIDIMHSKLTNTKYFLNWIRTKNGENSIVVGTRKSIFLPFLRLGAIILLEEHNLKYKSMNKCRYNMRDLGILRAYKENIPIILDSNTPSLKTLYNILHKKCFYIELHKCHKINRLKNSIIDLKKNKIQFGLSLTLINEICKNFKKKQVLLIFNYFSLFFFILTCSRCKFIFECNICNNYLEVNKFQNIIFCRFCLIKIKKPIFCYHCRLFSLVIKKIYLEEIKSKIQDLFPNIPLFFLLNKKVLNKKIFEFSLSHPYIIVTTEEIVQNYFFPNVTLIVLIFVDNHFFSFDFRAIEHFAYFYNNLSQLTRSIKKSLKILIQTSSPNNINLQEICNHEYNSFAKKILFIRKNFLLPPWSFQTIIYSESICAKNNITFLCLIRKILQIKSKRYNCFLWFLGPYKTPVLKNKKKNSHQLLIQCDSRALLSNALNKCIDLIDFFTISKKVKWYIDIEPD